MPDQFSNLSPLGIGQLQDQTVIPNLPKINFTDIPNFVAAPKFTGDQTPIDSNRQRPFDPFNAPLAGKDTVLPRQPFDNTNVRKLVNSNVFKQLGYNRDSNEEDRYDKAQSWWEATKNSTVKFFGKTWDSFASFFRQNLDTFDSLTNLDISKSWDNDKNVNSVPNDQDLDIKYPNFQSAKGTHWYSFIPFTSGSGDWWEQFVPQLGYTVGMLGGAAIENTLITLATGGTGEPAEAANTWRKIYGAISGFADVRRGTKLANAIIEGKAMLDNTLKLGAYGWTFYNAAASEGSLEAGMNYYQTKNDLVQDYKKKNGYMPIGQDMAKIEQAAKGAGNADFALNIPILMMSNAAQFGNLMFPSLAEKAAIGQAAKGIEWSLKADKWVPSLAIEKSFRELWKEGNFMQRTKLLGGMLANERNRFLMEGVEEELQYAAQTGTEKYYSDKYKNGDASAIESTGYGIGQMFTSEGWQNFIGGALGGLAFEGTGNFLSRFANAKKITDSEGNVKYEKSFLNKLGIYSEATKQDQKLENANRVAELLNTEGLQSIFKEEGFKNAFIAMKQNAAIEHFSEKGDMFNMKNLKNDALNRFLYSGLVTGKLDLKLKQLAEAKSLSDEDFRNIVGVDPTAETKENVGELVDHILGRASQFEAAFKSEGKRFEKATLETYRQFKTAQDVYKHNENRLKEKYNKESLDEAFSPIHEFYAAKQKEMLEAMENNEYDKMQAIHDEADKFDEDNKNLIEDWNTTKQLNRTTNDAFINHIAVQEGKKAAIFAYSDMNDSSRRAQSIMRDLSDNSYGLEFRKLDNLLDINSLRDQKKRLQEYSKALSNPVTKEQSQHKAEYDDMIRRLDEIENLYKDNKFSAKDAATKLVDYLANDPLIQKKESYRNWEYTQEKRNAHERQVEDLLKLQKRQQDNLDLYNRISTSDLYDDFTKHETRNIKDFLQRAYDYYTKSVQEEPVAEKEAEKKAAASDVKTEDITHEEVKTEEPKANEIDARVNTIKEKLSKGENLDNNDETFLKSAALVNNDAAEMLESHEETSKTPVKVGDIVLNEDKEETIKEIKPSPLDKNKKIVSFESDPGKFVPIDSVEKLDLTPLQRQGLNTTYRPEPDARVSEDDIEDTKSILEHTITSTGASEGHRTTVSELLDNKELSKDEPELAGGYVAFKQGFMNRIHQDDLLDQYTGSLEIDKADNYNEGSELRNFLNKNPEKAGLVLVVKTSSGEDRFDKNYLPLKTGTKLVYSLVSSEAKQQLLGLMKDKATNTIPIGLESISHGVIDKMKTPRDTSLLIAGLPETEYSFYIAVGEPQVPFFYDRGMKLRNGGLYLSLKGSYIKLLPKKSVELRVGSIQSPDIYSLLDIPYKSKEEAEEVAKFLETMFYTERDRGGVVFNITGTKSRYRIHGTLLSTGKALSMTAEEVKGALKNQRINVSNGHINGTFDFLYVVDGKLERLEKVDYNSFLADNTQTNKKSYKIGDQKVLKPINKFITLDTTLPELIERINKPDSSTDKVNDQIKEIKSTEQKGETKDDSAISKEPLKTRRRFGEGDSTTNDLKDELLSTKNAEDTSILGSDEVKFIKDRFGNDVVTRLVDVANSDAWGTWSTSGITLFADAVKGTGYHEAWHHFSQIYLTTDQKRDLYNELRQRVPKLRNATDLNVEEYAANDFKDYVISKGTKILGGQPARNTIFRKVWDFLRAIFTGKFNVDKLYRDLYRNNLNQYRPSINNAIFGKLNSRITDRRGNEIFNNQKSSRYKGYLDSVMGQAMSDAGINPSYLHTGDPKITRKFLADMYKRGLATVKQTYNDLTMKEEDLHAKGLPYEQVSDTLNDLEKIIDNYQDIVKAHRRHSAYDIQAVDEEDQNELDRTLESEQDTEGEVDDTEKAEADNAGKLWDGGGNELSLIQAASKETKAIIRAVSKVDTDDTGLPILDNGKVRLKTNAYGLTEPINFTQFFNNLGILLEGSYTVEEMLQKMKDQNNQRRYPELALLLERLPQLSENMKYMDIMLLTRFFKDFSKTYVPIYSLIKLKTGEFIFKEETKRTNDLIKRQWSNNFFTRTHDDTLAQQGYIQFDDNNRPYINPNSTLRFDFDKPAEVDKFLNLLGFSFGRLAKESAEYKRATSKGDLVFLINTLNQRLKAGQRIINPVVDLGEQFNYEDSGRKRILSEKKTINALIDVETKYTTESPSLSYRNAEGNMQYGLSINNWVFTNNYWLSRTQNYSQIASNESTKHLSINNNPNIKNSIFLRKLFDLNEKSSTFGNRRRVANEPITIEIGNYNGMKIEVSDRENKGYSTTRLTERDKIVMDINSLMSNGAIEFMRTGSSASAFFMRLNNYAEIGDTQRKHLPIMTEELEADFKNRKLLDIFNGYFEDEVNNIINKFNSTLPGYYNEKTGPGRFSLFKDILPEELRDRIHGDLRDTIDSNGSDKQNTTDTILQKYLSAVEKAVTNFFEREYNGLASLLDKHNITNQEISKSLTEGNRRSFTLRDLLSSFLVNDFIINTEYTKLFAGNPAFYKAYHKRSQGDTSTGTKVMTDNFIKNYLEETHDRTLEHSLGLAPRESIATTKTLVLKDDERQSIYLSHYMDVIKKLNPHFTDETVRTMLGIDKSGKHKGYKLMNVADGQGHCTLDFYRQLRISVGNWMYSDEIVYVKEVIGYRMDKDLYGKSVPIEQKERDERFLEVNKDAIAYFPSVKLQHNGPLNINGTFAPILDKFSIAPLIPSVIKGTNWSKIHDQMIEKGIGYSKFESGTKKYSYPAVDLVGNNWDMDLNRIHEVFTENLKEQVETKPQPKEESIWGTQMRKLFMANMFNSGVGSEKFSNLLTEYKSILDKIENLERKGLYSKFGITDHGDRLIIKNVKPFVDALQSEAEKRKLNENIKDSIQYDKDTGTFIYPLEINLNKTAIQDLISGLIFKRLTRLKLNGDMLIQVSNSGFEPTQFEFKSENDLDIQGTNSLPFYRMELDEEGNPVKTKAMKVKVALTREWKKLLNSQHPDGRKVETIDRLNALLKNESWVEKNRQKITMIGYRIPTQGPNSMDFMEVYEFVSENNGPVIYLPAEIVAKAGSDYDIDKMNVFRPSLTNEGDLYSEDSLPAIKKRIGELEQQITESLDAMTGFQLGEQGTEKGKQESAINKLLEAVFKTTDLDQIEYELEQDVHDLSGRVENLIKDYIDIKKADKKVLSNRVIDTYKDVLSSPEMFTQLITPNNVENIRPVAVDMAKILGLELGDYTDTDILKYESNINKFRQLLSGKRDIGIFALANTLSQLFQQSGMRINSIYNVERNSQKLPRATTLHLLSPEERSTIISNNQIDFSRITNVEGILIQELFSQLINSTVDIAADPYYEAFGFTRETIAPAIYTLLQGVPFRRVVLFMQQPIIKEYSDRVAKEPDQRTTHKKLLLGLNERTKAVAYMKYVEAVDTGDPNEFFSDSVLEHSVKIAKNNHSDYMRKAEGDNLAKQKRILAHFIKLQEQADAMRELQDTVKFDTAKYLSPISVQTNLATRDKVRASDLFDNEAVNKIRQDSLISAFNNLELIKTIFGTIMPVGMSAGIIAKSAEIMAELPAGKRDKITKVRLERVINNDWIEYIIKNFGEVAGQNYEEFADKFLKDTPENASAIIATRLGTMKSKYPELSAFELVRRLYANFSKINPALKNIELYRGLDNSPEFQDVLLEEYQALMDFQGNEIPGRTYKPDEVMEIRNFFRELQHLGFHQSGFNRSPISFVDVIPHQTLSKLFTKALDRYKDFIEKYPEAEKVVIDDFIDKFKNQNPRYGLYKDYNLINKESWRVKYYKSSMEAPNFVSSQEIPSPTMDIDFEIVPNAPKELPAPQKLLPSTSYTNHSGGASGADLMWDAIGRTYGVTDHKHYRPSDLAAVSTEVRTQIDKDVNNAARGLGRPQTEFNGKDLVRRNWFQVNGADEIFAVSRIVQPGAKDKGFINKSGKQVVSGGTGWAVEMAIQKGKPVHVFDMNTNKWYTWNVFQNKFMEEGVPRLTKNFAGIGSRELTTQGIQAINDVYTSSIGNLNLKKIVVAANHAMSYAMPAADNLTDKDTSTLQLAEQGIRTATTRSFPLGKIGDVITFEGRPQLYKITAVEQLTNEKIKDAEWIRQWSAKEQWTEAHFQKVLGGKTVHIGSYQTSFERIQPSDKDVDDAINKCK